MLNNFEKFLKILFIFLNLSGQYQLAAAACFYRLPIRMITIDLTAILVSEKVNYVNNSGKMYFYCFASRYQGGQLFRIMLQSLVRLKLKLQAHVTDNYEML